MSETVMICTDLGKISEEVISKGIELAQKLEAPIRLVHVLTGEKAVPHATPNASGSAAKDMIQVQNKLERAQERLRDSKCPFSTVTPKGNIVEELQKEVKTQDPYILVMGALNNTALRHVVSGSVAGSILNSTNCQVLLVPEPK
ncbi:MAG: universal stress protein [Spirochaetales bacterium]|nr:universal stress protein [Spirochaetales bacterium]